MVLKAFFVAQCPLLAVQNILVGLRLKIIRTKELNLKSIRQKLRTHQFCWRNAPVVKDANDFRREVFPQVLAA